MPPPIRLVLSAAVLLHSLLWAAAVHRDAWSDFLKIARDPHRPRELVDVDYRGRHPFEVNERRAQGTPEYQPIRVHFDTHLLDALSASHPSQVAYIRDTLLPPLREFWSEALSVVPASTIEVPLGGLCAQQAHALSGFRLKDFVANTTEDVALNSAGNSLVFEDTDLVMIVLPMEETPVCPADVTADSTIATLAFALNCQNDQVDRPTVGYTGICFGPLVEAQEGTKVYERQLQTIAHEMGHVLGVNSYDMAFYRHPATGEPRTPRNMFNRPPIKEVACVDGVRRAIVLPSENTIKLVTTANGYAAYQVVTETVRNVVRNQFDCQSLEGAQLENQPTSPDDCFGSHWDHRLFNQHLMVAAFTGTKIHLTALTLALLEDSGWYKADYSKIVENSPFGLGAGCEFVEEPCIDNGTVPEWAAGTFCSSDQNIGCTPDQRIVAFCGVSQIEGLPDGYQYFDNPTQAGIMPQRDFCPAFTSMLSLELGDGEVKTLDCTDASLGDTTVPFRGESFGEGSRCILSPMANLRPVCLETICLEDGEDAGKVAFLVEGVRTTCPAAGDVVRLSNGIDITCPRFEQICPQSVCPASCSGRGVCDFTLSPPRCQCFDAGDASPFCAESPLSVAPTNSPAPTQMPAMPSSVPTILATTPSPSTFPTAYPTEAPSDISAPESTPPITDSPTVAPATGVPTTTSPTTVQTTNIASTADPAAPSSRTVALKSTLTASVIVMFASALWAFA